MTNVRGKKSLLTGLVTVAAISASSSAFAAFEATDSVAGVDVMYGGDRCPTGDCVALNWTEYSVTGGATLFESINNVAARPGKDTDLAAESLVSSYSVTSSNDNPEGAINLIEVTGLGGLFDLYWGSIDSYNIIEFFSGGTSLGTFEGDEAEEYAPGSDGEPEQYNADAYFYFQGDFDRVQLSSSDGVAFEVARVPEPGTLALLGLGLAGIGAARRRKSA